MLTEAVYDFHRTKWKAQHFDMKNIKLENCNNHGSGLTKMVAAKRRININFKLPKYTDFPRLMKSLIYKLSKGYAGLPKGNSNTPCSLLQVNYHFASNPCFENADHLPHFGFLREATICK